MTPRKKNRGGPGRTGTHPRGPDGKAAAMLPRTIHAHLIGGALDGLELDVELDRDQEVPRKIRIPRAAASGSPYPFDALEYDLDRVGCEGSRAYYRLRQEGGPR